VIKKGPHCQGPYLFNPTPAKNEKIQIALKSMPDRSQVIFREIKNAGHFSFLSSFPEEMKNPNFLPKANPEGFDRDMLHAS
jgi:hypothetical protein